MTDDGTKPLRSVVGIHRDLERPGWARLRLSCGHNKEVEDFPEGTPPPCFRQICDVEGCSNA